MELPPSHCRLQIEIYLGKVRSIVSVEEITFYCNAEGCLVANHKWFPVWGFLAVQRTDDFTPSAFQVLYWTMSKKLCRHNKTSPGVPAPSVWREGVKSQCVKQAVNTWAAFSSTFAGLLRDDRRTKGCSGNHHANCHSVWTGDTFACGGSMNRASVTPT